jgi:hypothetical protein
MNDVTVPLAGVARKRAFGRSLGDFRIEGATTPNGLLPAEEKLLVDAARGEICLVSQLDWKKAEDLEKLKNDTEFRIRAGFLRFLLLGGDEASPVHEKGVDLSQAYIADDLDLEGCRAVVELNIRHSFLSGSLTIRDAHTKGLNLAGSRVAGIQGDRTRIDGPLFLRHGFLSEGEVRVSGAEIGGFLDCQHGVFRNINGDALNCDRAKIKDGVHLRNVETEGAVRLLGAEIGGDIMCDGSSFKNPGGTALNCDRVSVAGNVYLHDGFSAQGEVRLLAAEIGSDLICVGGSNFKNPGGDALDISGARIRGILFLRDNTSAEGVVIFSGAYTRNLIDDDIARGIAGPCELVLDGFTFERIGGNAPTDANTRIAWLMRQRKAHTSTDFRPQPFEQLAKVLAAMGHEDDARKVAMAKQRLMIPVRVRQAVRYAKPFVWLLWRLHQFTSGFGYRPIRLILILLALWLAGAAFYDQASEAGVFAPADLRVTTSPDLVAKCGANWTRCKDLGSLPGFYALTYSADVVLPVSDLGQRKVWTPSRRGFELSLPFGLTVPIPPGLTTHIVAIQSFLGSLGALLFGAIITGLIKKD